MSQRIAAIAVLALSTLAVPAHAAPGAAVSTEVRTEARIQRFESRREASEARREAEAARLRAKSAEEASATHTDPKAKAKAEPKSK